jgi:hypothetical protein
MAFILLAGAGYAYYKNQQQGTASANPYPLDPDIDLDGKTCIDFLPMELRSALLSNSVTTITFYKGDYRKVRGQVEHQVQGILTANPWLAGWCVREREIDSFGVAAKIFTVRTTS